MVVVSFIASKLNFAPDHVALKRPSRLVSGLLVQSRDITGSVGGKSSKLQDPVRLIDSTQVIAYASRPPISWSQNRPYGRIFCSCVITYLLPVISHLIRVVHAISNCIHPRSIHFFAQRCLGICSCFRFKGASFLSFDISPRFPWIALG